jgi:hypothetical protein
VYYSTRYFEYSRRTRGRAWKRTRNTTVLRLCKQIREEALETLYRENAFDVFVDGDRNKFAAEPARAGRRTRNERIQWAVPFAVY